MSEPVKSKFMALPLWTYIVGWCLLLYFYFEILGFTIGTPGNAFLSGLYVINFGVHEISHIIISFLPAIIVSAAGSIGEMGFTVLVLAVALKAKAWFASVIAAIWVMFAMNSAGQYMADARTQLIPLIGPGDTVKHDWNFVFGELGWLQYDTLIGGIVRITGDVIGAIALLIGLWLIVLKVISKE